MTQDEMGVLFHIVVSRLTLFRVSKFERMDIDEENNNRNISIRKYVAYNFELPGNNLYLRQIDQRYFLNSSEILPVKIHLQKLN